MTPTREQMTAAPLDAYSAEDRAFFAFWYAHMKDDLMQPPLHAVEHSVAKIIFAAGRDQGLREAKEVCEAKAASVIKSNTSRGRTNSAAVFSSGLLEDCAAAIEQLRRPRAT